MNQTFRVTEDQLENFLNYLLNFIRPTDCLFLKFCMENVRSLSAIYDKCPVTWYRKKGFHILPHQSVRSIISWMFLEKKSTHLLQSFMAVLVVWNVGYFMIAVNAIFYNQLISNLIGRFFLRREREGQKRKTHQKTSFFCSNPLSSSMPTQSRQLRRQLNSSRHQRTKLVIKSNTSKIQHVK